MHSVPQHPHIKKDMTLQTYITYEWKILSTRGTSTDPAHIVGATMFELHCFLF